MPTLTFGTLRHIDRDRRRVVIGTAEFPVGTDISLEGLQAGTPIKVVTDVQGGQQWVTAIEVDR
jgi:Cu/Ag efflux protein CusF